MFRIRIEKAVIVRCGWSDCDKNEGEDTISLATGDELVIAEELDSEDDCTWMKLAQEGPAWVIGLPHGSWTAIPAIIRNTQGAPAKKGYSPEDVGEMFERSAYTVREWCKHGLIRAEKDKTAGRTGSWVISPEEVERIRNEGCPVMGNKWVTESASAGQDSNDTEPSLKERKSHEIRAISTLTHTEPKLNKDG